MPSAWLSQFRLLELLGFRALGLQDFEVEGWASEGL